MRHLRDPARRRRRVAIDAAMLFIIVLLVVQMWLLTAALESFLAGHAGWPSPRSSSRYALCRMRSGCMP